MNDNGGTVIMQTHMIRMAEQQHTQTINQAVLNIQKMSKDRQREVFDMIDLICLRDGLYDKVQPKTDNADENAPIENLESGFMSYLTDWRTKNANLLDDDDPWGNVREKQDFGREFSWGAE